MFRGEAAYLPLRGRWILRFAPNKGESQKTEEEWRYVMCKKKPVEMLKSKISARIPLQSAARTSHADSYKLWYDCHWQSY